MNRKYFMTPLMRPKNSVLLERKFTVREEDGNAEHMVEMDACPKNENNDGWLQFTATKFGKKRSTSVYVCLSRQQAIGLRDMLNAAFGGSSRIEKSIEGSRYIADEREVS